MTIAIRYFTLTVLLGAMLWIGNSPYEVEPYVAALAALATFLGLDVRLIRDASHRRPDRKLLARLIETLPANGSIAYIDRRDWGGWFESEALDQLYTFHRKWNGPDCEFLDAELERKRAELAKAAREFFDAIGKYTWRDSYNQQHSVPKEWAWERPQEHRNAVAELDRGSDNVVAAYKDLVRTARRKLGEDDD